jgi:lipopolysaccharide transport protein LptA
MKLFLICLSLGALGLAPLCGQTTDAMDTPPPPGATVITSDELHMDQIGHTAIFTGNVIVTGTNFKMTCEEMTVFFTTANKIDHILATGSVVIIQPGRITHCGQAIYYHDEDKFVLTDQPDILDNKNEIQAPEITIFRAEKKLTTKGRTKTTIIQGMGSSTNSVDTPAEPK